MKFWQTKTFAEMTHNEWESLCDGCGKCCLHKLEDEETDEVYYTNVACRLLNLDTCRCTDYLNRTRLVPECIDLKQHDIAELTWLPTTCAYRLIAENKGLPTWHPLISSNESSVKDAGVNVSSFAITESEADDMEDHIIEWLE